MLTYSSFLTLFGLNKDYAANASANNPPLKNVI